MIKNTLFIFYLLIFSIALTGCRGSSPKTVVSVVIANNMLENIDIFVDGAYEITIHKRGVGLVEWLNQGTYTFSAYSNGHLVKSEFLNLVDDMTWIVD